MDDLPDAGVPRGFKDVERAEDVRLHRLPGMNVGVRDGDERTEVEDNVNVPDGVADGARVFEVAHDNPHPLQALLREQPQEAGIVS
jgi:hypothetical protein